MTPDYKKIFQENTKGTELEGSYLVAPDDTIEFECTRCGKCCKDRTGDNSILLTAIDVYNAAKALGITCPEFVREYCNVSTGPDTGIKIVSLKCDKKTGYCLLHSFDKNGLSACSIHKAKPVLCALHPLGYVYKDKNTDYPYGDLRFFKTPSCAKSQHGVRARISGITSLLPCTIEEIDTASDLRYHNAGFAPMLNIVRNHAYMNIAMLSLEGITDLNIPDDMQKTSEQFFNLFKSRFGVPQFLRGTEEPERKEHIMKVFDSIMDIGEANLACSYTNYDTSKPFLNQVDSNREGLEETLAYLKAMSENIIKYYTEGRSSKVRAGMTELLKSNPSMLD